MSLSDVKIRNSKPREKPVMLFDGSGLYLLVTPQGGKLWRMKYRYEGKEKLLALGTYPEISLADARQRQDEARRQLAHGIDPGTLRKAQKQAKTEETETFEVIAREWHTKFTPTWTTGHSITIMSRLERDLFPWIGVRPIKQIKAPELLTVLRRVKAGVRWSPHTGSGLSPVKFSVTPSPPEGQSVTRPAISKGHCRSQEKNTMQR